jgi:DNA-directed RNA polymerase subunit beta
MRDEDDDLLRAAEELGIDLSGVRNTDGAAADEAVESEDDTDAAPSDEEPEAEAEADIAGVEVDEEIDMGDVEIPEPDTEEAEA